MSATTKKYFISICAPYADWKGDFQVAEIIARLANDAQALNVAAARLSVLRAQNSLIKWAVYVETEKRHNGIRIPVASRQQVAEHADAALERERLTQS